MPATTHPLSRRLRGYRLGALFIAQYIAVTGAGYLHVVLTLLMPQVLRRVTRTAPTNHDPRVQWPISACSTGLLTHRDFVQVNEPGFGDRWNTYPWSMQWWQGKLYVGTARAHECIAYFALHTFLPLLQRYPPRSDPHVQCPACVHDLPLQAEIWCYTPRSGAWTRVYQAPNDVAISGLPGCYTARDIGYRRMIAFTEPNGTEALYVCGVSARIITREGPPPRLLRSIDGCTFEAVRHDPGTVLGNLTVEGFRSLAVHDGRLYVVAAAFYGDGLLLEAENPAGGNDYFRPVSPPGLRIGEVISFSGHLYATVRDVSAGYMIVKVDTRRRPYTFTPVVTKGGYRKPLRSHGAFSMAVFKDALYVGTEVPGELIRIYSDDTWDLIIGKPRKTPQGPKAPLCTGMDEIDCALSMSLQRMQVHDGWLYVASDTAVRLKLMQFPVRDYLGPNVFATPNGVDFVKISLRGLATLHDRTGGSATSDPSGMSVGSIASTPIGLFVGLEDPARGMHICWGTHRA